MMSVVVVVIGLVPTVSSGESQSSAFQVLWDISHGVNGDYEPSGRFRHLVQHLGVHGFSMNTTSQGFLVDDPAPYDVIVVCGLSSKENIYTSAEVARIVGFVNDGGGLLIMGDNPDTSNWTIQPVASSFGVALEVSHISPYDTYTANLASHRIFNGISEIYMRSAGEISAVTPSFEVAWQEGTGMALVAAATYGNGRVVTTGDANMWGGTEYYNLVDNRQFSLNTFEYLAVREHATLSFDNQAVADSNWSSPGNWDDLPDPGTAIPRVYTITTVGNGHTVGVVTAGQVCRSLHLTDTATLNIATAASPTTGDLTVSEAVSVGPTAVLNVYNTLTAQIVVSSGTMRLCDSATVDGAVTVMGGSFTGGVGVTVGSLRSESTALHVGAGGITIANTLSRFGTSEWVHTGAGNFTVDNSITGNLMDGLTELLLNGGELRTTTALDLSTMDIEVVENSTLSFPNSQYNDLTVAAGKALTLNGAAGVSFTSLTIGGAATIDGSSTVRLSTMDLGGTLNLNNVAFDSGAAIPAGRSVVASGDVSGTVAVAGNLTAPNVAASNVTVTDPGAVITVTNQLTVDSVLDMSAGGPNEGNLVTAGASITTSAGGHLMYDKPLSAAAIHVPGGLLDLGGGGVFGTVNVSDGTFNLGNNSSVSGSVMLTSGLLTVGTGVTFDADVAVSNGALNVGSGAMIGGTLDVTGGQVTLGGGNVGAVDISGGTISLGNNVSTPTVALSGGTLDTQTSALIISNTFQLPIQDMTITTDVAFAVAGSDLLNSGPGKERAFTLLGGTTTIARPIPPGGALTYWSFDSVGGSTVVNDGSLRVAADGALNGDAAIVTGGVGGTDALSLNGAGYMEVLNAITGLGNSDASTISLWVKTTDIDGTYLRKCDGDDTWDTYEASYYLKSGQMAAMRSGRGTGTVQGSTIVTDDAWHHIVLVNDHGVKTIYVDDGSPDTLNEGNFNKDNDADDTVIRIGWTAGDVGPNSFEGLIDEFRIYRRALTEAEVHELYGDGDGVGSGEINLPYTNIAASVSSTLILDGTGTPTFRGVSLDNGVRLGISSEFDIHLTNLALGDGSTLAADDRDMEVTVSGTLSSVGSTSHLGGPAETYQVSLTLETGARYEWEFGKSGGVVSGDLVVVNGDLTLGDDWVLEFIPAAGSEWFDGTEQVDLFSFTGALTGDLGNVLFDAPADWITDAVTLHEELNRGGAGVNYIYMTGLETVPEPSSVILMLIGLAAAVRRRSRSGVPPLESRG